MRLYLDTSALLKLVVYEPESNSLSEYLDEFLSDARFTVALTRTELVRAVARRGPVEAVQHARRLLSRLDAIALSDRLLDTAATMTPPGLRTLDAIHLAGAMSAPNLRAIVTYDSRLADAATSNGITVVAPG